jgi:hypothetical protein
MKESHTTVSRLDIVRGHSITTFNVIDGLVVFDFDDTTRRSLDVTLVDETNRTYAEMQSLTDPFISELRPYRGVQFAPGDIEWVPLGTYFTHQLDIMDNDSMVHWRIAGLDASSRAMTAVESPFFIENGTPIDRAVPSLIQKVYPPMTFAISASPFLTPTMLITEDSNPWEEAEHLANSSGNDLWMSRNNVCIMGARARTAQEQYAMWHFTEGVDATFWSPVRSFQQRMPNVVIVIGTNPLAPGARGEAYDADPQSPTYINGPYGRQVEVIKSELVNDSTQAALYAGNILTKRLGPQDELTFECVPNPALDESDTITLTRDRMGMIKRPVLISHIECPLVADSGMRITGRRSIFSEGRLTEVRPNG